ncbi:hypothetical protein DL766_009235 [Monosporascus sp. MC13-8B]|uniref:Uncharacterized protein n=1 Tax=Monosporascus cannonballus TaxID=155416 RepID=A0ABY0HCV5_9PEZI|nr:hypothetical protein DL762_003719 [Monosporascus cannonballus]RYP00565.1 hypothetical protein DL763_000762 [Monosporascus cannonballus]RYP16025.1 hypothetical protein DL766_009235 [Monosporascus sp. MC13-8B]
MVLAHVRSWKEVGGLLPGEGIASKHTDALRASSFSSDAYNKIGQQSCFAPEDESIWYTCKATDDNPTPFMGCCKGNPCSAKGCTTNDLYPARLSDNPDKARIFLSGSSTASPDSDSSSDSSSPLGVIIGITLGGVAFIGILIAFFLMYRKGWLGKKRKTEKQADEAANLYSPSVQGQYSPGFVGGWPGSQPGSPPAYPPYSPMYNDRLYPTASDWNGDSRHVSQISGMTWSDVATNAAHKHYSVVQQEQPASELDGMIRTNKAPQGQQTMELEGRDTEVPRVAAELPANGS